VNEYRRKEGPAPALAERAEAAVPPREQLPAAQHGGRVQPTQGQLRQPAVALRVLCQRHVQLRLVRPLLVPLWCGVWVW